MNSKQIRGLIGSTIVLPLSFVVLASSPALALVFQFCGNFLDGSGGVGLSFIEVDDVTGEFDGAADITTEVFGDVRTYDATNFVERQLVPATVDNPESYRYIFSWNQVGSTDVNNNFEVFLPTNIFANPQLLNSPIAVNNFETRDGITRQEFDVPSIPPVPTPGHFLGLLSALGFGGLKAKKQLDTTEEEA